MPELLTQEVANKSTSISVLEAIGRTLRWRGKLPLSLAALTLAGCAVSVNGPVESTSQSAESSTSAAPTRPTVPSVTSIVVRPPAVEMTQAPATTSAEVKSRLRFNDRKGGEPEINVYMSPMNAAAGGKAVNDYPHGTEREVACWTNSQELSTRTDLGEEPDTSDIWFKLANTGAGQQWVNDIYADIIEGTPYPKPC